MSLGDMVWYWLDEADTEGISQRRENFQLFNHGASGHKHPHHQGKARGAWLASGHIAHIGNPVVPGEQCAAMVTRVNADGTLNLRVILDGSDVHWVCSAPQGRAPGCWNER